MGGQTVEAFGRAMLSFSGRFTWRWRGAICKSFEGLSGMIISMMPLTRQTDLKQQFGRFDSTLLISVIWKRVINPHGYIQILQAHINQASIINRHDFNYLLISHV